MPKIFRYDKEKVTRKKARIPEFEWLTSCDLSLESNIKDFTCNIRVLEKGKYSYPYHFHKNAEELFVILKGKGKLRVPDGIFDITSGDIIIFENGKTGAHQVYNDSEESLVYLDLRTIHSIDVCEYPDSGKVNILPFKEIYYKGKQADYFDGEDQILKVWSNLLKKQ